MNNRLLSLDFFRGLTVAGMILVNNPGDWGHVYAPLLHAQWNGCTPTDLVFPFFLFIVGVSISFAMGKTKPPLIKIVRRAAILFALGMILSLYPKFDFAYVRIPGVLQRIALVYLVASLIFLHTNHKTQIYITAAILILYCILMNYVPVPGLGFATMDAETNLGAWLDRTILGTDHLWRAVKTWDPEGLLSTLPAIATGMIGALTGQWLKTDKPITERLLQLFLVGNALILSGLIWNESFPINKSLWTSSYVLYTGGWAMVALAACYWLIDVCGYRKGVMPFVYFGVNAITVFFLSGIIPRTLNIIKIGEIDAKTWLFKNGIAVWFSNSYMASLAGALVFLVIWYFILRFMFKKNVIIKI
jgi:predicted acyltransferase